MSSWGASAPGQAPGRNLEAAHACIAFVGPQEEDRLLAGGCDHPSLGGRPRERSDRAVEPQGGEVPLRAELERGTAKSGQVGPHQHVAAFDDDQLPGRQDGGEARVRYPGDTLDRLRIDGAHTARRGVVSGEREETIAGAAVDAPLDQLAV